MRVKALGAALVLALSPVALGAQLGPSTPASPPTPGFAVQVSMGWESHASEVIAADRCPGIRPKRVEATARVGLTRWLFLEGAVARYDRIAGECSIDPATPPLQGPATIRTRWVERDIEGYPFITTGVRVGAGTTDPTSQWTWRVAAGPLWIWKKSLAGASAKLELAYHFPDSPLEVVGGFSVLCYAVPYADGVTQYVDGVAMSSTIVPGRETATPRVISVGAAWSF